MTKVQNADPGGLTLLPGSSAVLMRKEGGGFDIRLVFLDRMVVVAHSIIAGSPAMTEWNLATQPLAFSISLLSSGTIWNRSPTIP